VNAPPIAWSAPPKPIRPVTKTKAAGWLKDLHGRLESEEFASLSAALKADEDFSAFLSAVFDLSPYLRETALTRPKRLADILAAPPSDALEAILEGVGDCGVRAESESAVKEALRRAKAKVALLCGLADLGGWWKGEQVTLALSRFADAALAATLDFLLLQLHRSEKLVLPDTKNPQTGSGLIVLGMGKYGARELNYSSDIDIIVFFDPDAMKLNTDDPVSLYTRLVKSLIRIMQERTGDGYVFRTDLRLRPDPGSMPLAIPLELALNYYEAYGQNWERAAMIKARPVAGDLDAGQAFLKEIAPFVWRKYLDYAAIFDVHSIKRQIQAHRGFGSVAVAGHNVKLGRGGIREIEFFAQTQQLIAGGRIPQLRCLKTLDALAGLEKEGWIDAEARDELSKAYWYLRDVEHRIQMVADEQSHVLPEDAAGLKRIAHMMGEEPAAFEKHLLKVLRTVEKHYAELFEAAPELGGGGNLVFTGDDEDPATVETLSKMGFRQPSEVIRAVRGWHYGRIAAVRSSQAREILTELTPGLLEAIAATGAADRTLAAFDRFLGGLPAGIQFFSLMKSNPGMLNLLMLILGSAPRLADIITRRPHVFDGLLDPAFSQSVPDAETMRETLEGALARAPVYEAKLDAARIFAAEQKFLIGARLLTHTIDAERAGHQFTMLADVLIQAILDCVCAEFADTHGRVPGARLCVLGMGRLGSRELTAGSDLDLVLLYDHDPEAEQSDGAKPLAVSQYFIRLTQRLIAAMSAPTAEGVVYELDFRLRPSGNAGPLATHIEAFAKYQRQEAWTWERQALTRARPVAGDPAFMSEIEGLVRELLTAPGDSKKLASEIADMRWMIDKEKGSKNPFHIKAVPGGMADVEFLAQWAALSDGLDDGREHDPAIPAMIAAAPDKLLNPALREQLRNAWQLYNTVFQILRICISESFEPAQAPAGLNELLSHLLDMPDIKFVESELKNTQKSVRESFNRCLG